MFFFPPDGVFTIKPPGRQEVKTYCDFTTEGGPWTLLVTSKTHGGWDTDNIKERNSDRPSIHADFSILGFADAIKDFDNSQVIHLFFCLSVSLSHSVSLSLSLFLSLSVSVPLCLCLCLCMPLFLCLSVCLTDIARLKPYNRLRLHLLKITAEDISLTWSH